MLLQYAATCTIKQRGIRLSTPRSEDGPPSLKLARDADRRQGQSRGGDKRCSLWCQAGTRRCLCRRYRCLRTPRGMSPRRHTAGPRAPMPASSWSLGREREGGSEQRGGGACGPR